MLTANDFLIIAYRVYNDSTQSLVTQTVDIINAMNIADDVEESGARVRIEVIVI